MFFIFLHFFRFHEYNVRTNREGEKAMEESNEKSEVILFTAPKKVKRSKLSDVFLFQLITCTAFVAFLFVLKLSVPQIFENIISFIRGYIL